MSKGYIYCVSTPANVDRCKVGETLKGIGYRLKGLNNTSVSENFKLDFYIVVDAKNRFNIETSIHNEIIKAGFSRFTGKEFFKCLPDNIKSIFEKYGKVYTKINEHELVEMSGGDLEDDDLEENINILTNKIRKCGRCNKVFNKISHYKDHLNRKFPCKLHEPVNTEINKNDIKEKIKLKLRKCDKCNKIFDKKSTYDNHILRKTSCVKEDIEYKCNMCNKIFSTKYNLNVHANICKNNYNLVSNNHKIEELKKMYENKIANLQKDIDILIKLVNHKS